MATSDMFLKLEGVAGEAQDKAHKGEIDIQSFSWGLSNGATMGGGGGGGAGKVSFNDIHIMKEADKASPELMKRCATGEHIKLGLITVRKAGKEQQEFYKIKLSDIIVASVSNDGAPGGRPHESLTLNFAKIEFSYKEQKADGTLGGEIAFAYNIKENA